MEELKVRNIIIGKQFEKSENLEKFLDFSKVKILKIGGQTRAESVLNGLQYVKQNFHENSQKIFALIHDAARPLLKQQTLQKFIQQILLFYQQNPSQNVGGLLSMPLADTLKSEKNQQVIKTIPREHLFLAQTPQMFLFDVLFSALQNCSDCTDESSAVEKLNYHPLNIESCISLWNIREKYLRKDRYFGQDGTKNIWKMTIMSWSVSVS